MCDFCDTMKRNNRFERFFRKGDIEISYRYYIVLVQQALINGRILMRGNTKTYMDMGIECDLNYCPECGKKIEGCNNE